MRRSEENLTLGILLLSEDEGSASRDGETLSDLPIKARSLVFDRSLKLDSSLLGELGLLAEDGLGLATKAFLLSIITTFALSCGGVFAFLVLRNFPDNVLASLFAVRALLLGVVDHF